MTGFIARNKAFAEASPDRVASTANAIKIIRAPRVDLGPVLNSRFSADEGTTRGRWQAFVGLVLVDAIARHAWAKKLAAGRCQ